MFGFRKFEENAKKRKIEKKEKNEKIDFKSINYCFSNLELLIVWTFLTYLIYI